MSQLARFLIVVDTNVATNEQSFGLGQFVKLAEDTLLRINAAIAGSNLPALEPILVDDFKSGDLAKALSCDTVRACMLFGHDGAEAANQADIAAFKSFIRDRNGRCFATGDHETLGANLSGQLHGFERLRLWKGPGANHSRALDTRVRPRAAELDAYPKPVFSNWSWGPERRVHPICDFTPDLPICFLPDHGHEGGLNLSEPCEEGWTSHDIMHAIIRTVRMNYVPEVVPIVRVLDHDDGARLIADSTIHHWLNESWTALANSDAIDHVRAYVQNVVIHLIPDQHLEAAGQYALKVINSNSRLRELTDKQQLGTYASAVLAREDLFLWRILRALMPRPVLHSEDGTCTPRLEGRKRWLDLPAEPVASGHPSFDDDLAEALIRLRTGVQTR